MVRSNSPSPVRARDNNKEDHGLTNAATVGTPRSIWDIRAERTCDRCKGIYDSVSALKKHQSEDRRCRLSQVEFEKLEREEAERRKQIIQKQIPCRQCKKVYSSMSSLMRHKKNTCRGRLL